MPNFRDSDIDVAAVNLQSPKLYKRNVATEQPQARYVTAARRLVISADDKIVYNPSNISVWFSSDGKSYEIKGGETIKFP